MASNEIEAGPSETNSSPQQHSIDLNRPQINLSSSTSRRSGSGPPDSHTGLEAPEVEQILSPPPAPSILAQDASTAESQKEAISPSKRNAPRTISPHAVESQYVASTSPAPLSRVYSTAIGPSSDQPLSATKDSDSSGPTLLITLLLINGARHPFKLDGKYLHKRNVSVPGNDPFNLSVYKLKELILREWREEWEAKPSSPSYIRLISFGKLLDDKAPLKDSKFNHDAPNVVHMTIKPLDYIDEEDAKGSKTSFAGGRETNERSPGCRCTVM